MIAFLEVVLLKARFGGLDSIELSPEPQLNLQLSTGHLPDWD
jgi:hypothetical protein